MTVSTVINVSTVMNLTCLWSGAATQKTLPLQFIIADAIVWWRACAIWRSRVIYWIAPLLVILTLSELRQVFAFILPADTLTVFGIVGVYVSASQTTPTTMLGLLLGGNAFTYVSVMLSLITNVAATSLIACKAWWVLVILIVYSKTDHDMVSIGDIGSWSRLTSMQLAPIPAC